ncbi:LysR family transcriptional regulator [Kerstersia gyiorum]|uniref:LysR family transcriptional regulator n=1 Tax=Kerstersia gyiorum TaxID=206506 RepID=UPI0020A18A38|nr:LysR family transcriptional regulator [Kerstersia gyiorum]MCP1670333.1 DNA-binding transcriptional LysR family regulator [Kerstersia gyiorum]MCP1708240.1 DNA-binding transcriptional LysR family regulator [Kerstersia gyiorum]
MNPARLNWDNLRIFLAVARAHTALDAAQLLDMDHSTITRRLRRLENEIGSLLFSRTTQGHALTPEGTRLLNHIEKIEATLGAMESDIRNDAQAISGQVRLGATEGLGCAFLAPHLAHFCDRHRDIVVDLLAVPRFVNLSKREADLAVTIERPAAGAYVACKLSDYRLQLYATSRYLATHPPIRNLRDLASHRLTGYVDDLVFSAELSYLAQIAPQSRVPLRSTNVIAQLHAARQGKALAVLPCFLAADATDLIPVLPGKARITRNFWLVTPAEHRQVTRVRVLWDYLREIAEVNQAYLMGETTTMRWLTAPSIEPANEAVRAHEQALSRHASSPRPDL